MDSRLRQLADELFVQADAGAIVPGAISAKILPYMFILDIEQDKFEPTEVRLRVRLTGTAVDRLFSRPTVGHLLEEFVHGPRGDDVIDGFHYCAKEHEPLWMRQVVLIEGKVPRFVEGIAIYLAPEKICGGIVAGEMITQLESGTFERQALSRTK